MQAPPAGFLSGSLRVSCGSASPAMDASRSTASPNGVPSVSIRKSNTSPCLPEEKAVIEALSGR